MKPLKVFISYSHSDLAVAREIEERLISAGIPCFRDQTNIALGEAIPPVVLENIRSSSHLLVIVSPESESSAWVNYEIGFAHGVGAIILPILTRPGQRIPTFIGNLKCATSTKDICEHLLKVRDNQEAMLSALIPMKPYSEAQWLADRHGHKEVIVGTAIEVWTHSTLDSCLPVEKIGVEPSTFTFVRAGKRSFEYALDRCGGLVQVPPPNRAKYGISKLPVGTTDDESRIVEFFETDWQTWISVRDRVSNDSDLRADLTSLTPEKSHLPQSMSYQFLVRFSGGQILAMKRNSNLASHPDTWSFSGEEQICERDFAFSSNNAAENLVRRAFVEEVFGSRDNEASAFLNTWETKCRPILESSRIWSFFLEESVGSFHAFGVYQLKIPPSRLAELHRETVKAALGTTDDEGKFFVIDESEA